MDGHATLGKWVFPSCFINTADEVEVGECEDETAELIAVWKSDIASREAWERGVPQPEVCELSNYIRT